MKRDRFSPDFTELLKHRTFFMFFCNPSVRTRQSFECAATELGGHAQFLEPKSMRLKTEKTAGETIEDAAQVMSRYACGIGIRMLEDSIGAYGEGDALIREYARWANVPVVSHGPRQVPSLPGVGRCGRVCESVWVICKARKS